MPLAKRLGAALKFFREGRHFSQEQVARALDTSRGFISKLERGRVNTKVATLERLASFFKIELVALFLDVQNECENTGGQK